jgi:hypothetical protein
MQLANPCMAWGGGGAAVWSSRPCYTLGRSHLLDFLHSNDLQLAGRGSQMCSARTST